MEIGKKTILILLGILLISQVSAYGVLTVSSDSVSGSSYNATYDGLINNASYLSTYNISYHGSLNNASYLSTFNSTYANFAYNQSQFPIDYLNSTYGQFWYNMTGGSGNSYNETYDMWAYNQTTPAIDFLTNTYGANWYNHTSAVNVLYGQWFYNQTEEVFNLPILNNTYALIGSGGNASWNESKANDLYSSIIWGYNQTTATQSLYGSNWYNHTLATFNLYGSQWYNHTSTIYNNNLELNNKNISTGTGIIIMSKITGVGTPTASQGYIFLRDNEDDGVSIFYKNNNSEEFDLTGASAGGCTDFDCLSDIVLNTPANGQTLIYMDGNWINYALSHDNLTGIGVNNHTTIDLHLANTNNPHSVTTQQIGAVNITGDQTIAGTKIFSSPPESATIATTVNQLVNYGQVSGLVQGVGLLKAPTRLATTSALYLDVYYEFVWFGEQDLLTIDGEAVVSGDRILVKDQSGNPELNGIWIVGNIGEFEVQQWTMSRATDYDEDTEVVRGSSVSVLEGSTQTSTLWVQIEDDPTVNADPINFNQLPVANTPLAGNGLGYDLATNTFYVKNHSGGGLNSSSVGLGVKYYGTDFVILGDGSLAQRAGGTNRTDLGTDVTQWLYNQTTSVFTMALLNQTIDARAGEGGGSSFGTNNFTIMSIDFISSAGASTSTAQAWTNQPLAYTEFPNSRKVVDLRTTEQSRIVLNMKTVGSPNSKLWAEYSVDSGSSWANLSSTGDFVYYNLTIGTTNPFNNSWSDIPSGAKTESTWLRIVGIGGTGTVDPNWASLSAQFKVAALNSSGGGSGTGDLTSSVANSTYARLGENNLYSTGYNNTFRGKTIFGVDLGDGFGILKADSQDTGVLGHVARLYFLDFGDEDQTEYIEFNSTSQMFKTSQGINTPLLNIGNSATALNVSGNLYANTSTVNLITSRTTIGATQNALNNAAIPTGTFLTITDLDGSDRANLEFFRPGTSFSSDTTLGLITAWSNSTTAPVSVAGLQFGLNGTNEDAGKMWFYTKPAGGALTIRMMIDSLGVIGMGTSTPDADFRTHIVGDALGVTSSNSVTPNIATGAGDVYIEDDLEVDGVANRGGADVYLCYSESTGEITKATGGSPGVDGCSDLASPFYYSILPDGREVVEAEFLANLNKKENEMVQTFWMKNPTRYGVVYEEKTETAYIDLIQREILYKDDIIFGIGSQVKSITQIPLSVSNVDQADNLYYEMTFGQFLNIDWGELPIDESKIIGVTLKTKGYYITDETYYTDKFNIKKEVTADGNGYYINLIYELKEDLEVSGENSFSVDAEVCKERKISNSESCKTYISDTIVKGKIEREMEWIYLNKDKSTLDVSGLDEKLREGSVEVTKKGQISPEEIEEVNI